MSNSELATRNAQLVVYGAAGSGSVPVEAALTLMGVPYRVEEVTTWESEAERDRIAPINPMRQIPALVTPAGEVITESAAIQIWLGDTHPQSGLAPAPDDPRRAQYLRWMTWIPAAIYWTYWVRDVPSRLAADAAQEAVILERTAERVAECWRLMDAQVNPAPFILGERMTLLDIYVAVVSRWTPRRRRFYAEAPKLAEVVRRVDADPRLQAFWAARFPFEHGWEG